MTEVWITLRQQQNRTAIAFGYLISSSTVPLEKKRTFIGVEAHRKVPVELAAIAFLGASADHTLLIVDEFQKANKVPEQYVADGKAALKAHLEALQSAFGFKVNVVEASSFMHTPAYDALYRDTRKQIIGSPLEELLRKSLPRGVNDLTYSINEVAVTKYMEAEYGSEVKVGQGRERLYDAAIGAVTNLGFAYLLPTFAFVTGCEVKTPYNPESGTKEGGKRLMLGEPMERFADIIRQGPENAQLALAKIGYAAAALKNKDNSIRCGLKPELCIQATSFLIEEYEVARARKKFEKYRTLE